MTVSIISGPAWLSLNANGRPQGVPPTAGAYSVQLSATNGSFTATKTVTIYVSDLQVTQAPAINIASGFGMLVLAFDAAIDLTEQTGYPKLVLSFSAEAIYAAFFGKLMLDFTAFDPANVKPTPGSIDFYEPNNTIATATPISNGVFLHNTLHTAVDEDRFKFELTAPSTVQLELADITLPAGATDGLYLSITSSDTSTEYVNANMTSLPSFSVTTSMLQAGMYYLYVASSTGNFKHNSYSVKVTWTVPATLNDAGEPNYSSVKATQLTVGAAAFAGVLPVGDVDWFKFTLASAQFLTLALTGMTQPAGASPGLNIVISRRNANGTVSTQLEAFGLTTLADLSYRMGQFDAGDYSIRLASQTFFAGDYSYSAYNLALATRSVIANLGAGDSFASPQAIASGSPITSSLFSTSSAIDGDNFYRFTMAAAGSATVTMSGIATMFRTYTNSTRASLDWYLRFEADGQSGGEATTYSDQIITASGAANSPPMSLSVTKTLTGLSAGAYILRVSGVVDSYTIQVTY